MQRITQVVWQLSILPILLILEPQFTWEGSDPDSGDTLTYTLYVDATDGKQTPPSAQTGISAKTLDVALEAATTYYWRVKTSDGTNSSYSIVYSFKTQ